MTTVSSFEMKAGAGMPRTLRLTSQTTYKRPHRDAPAPGATTVTSYDATIGGALADSRRAAELCTAARASVKFNDMVHEAVSKLGADAYDTAMAAAADAVAADAAATKRAAEIITTGAVPAGGGAAAPPEVEAREVAAFGKLSEVLAKDERHGIRGAMVADFFAGGSIEGPFAGARSAQGDWMASTFYAHARPLGGLFATLKPSPYTDGGARLHNHARIG